MVLKCERKSKEEPNEVPLAPNETSTMSQGREGDGVMSFS